MKNNSIKTALGELTVIVLGVLIALFAESAWNDYQDRTKARTYLGRLSDEIKTNVEFLSHDTAWTKMSCTSIETALAQIRSEEDQQDSALALRHASFAAMYVNAEYQRVTYDDLIETGNLALISDASLREDIVSTYTIFFEALDAWRPSKESALRTAVLRTVPGEYIERVVAECVMYPEGELPSWKDCDTAPAARSADYWLDRLASQSGLEGLLMERAWQVCQFEDDMAERRDKFNSLSLNLGDAGK